MGWDGPVTYEQHLAWKEWLAMDYDVPSRADLYALNTASCVAGKELDPLKFKPATHSQPRELTAPRYHNATDDTSTYWEPHPLTEEEFIKLNQCIARNRAKRGN